MFGERPTFYRKTLGVFAIVISVVAATAVFLQVADLMGQQAFVWDQYFSYFTILTTVLNVAALLFGGLNALSTEKDGVAHTVLRQSLVTYALASATVYHLILRDLGSSTDEFVSADNLPMLLFHTYVPLYLLLDWLINPYRSRAPFSSLVTVFVLPALWLGVTLFRGQTNGWFPYQFLNPTSAGGWAGVVDYIAGLALVIFLLQLALLGTNRRYHRTKRRRRVTA